MYIFVNTAMRTGSTHLCGILGSLFNSQFQFWARGMDIPIAKFCNPVDKSKVNLIKLHWADPNRIQKGIEGLGEYLGYESKRKIFNSYQIILNRGTLDTIVSMIFYIRDDQQLDKLKHLTEYNKIRQELSLTGVEISDKDYINTFIRLRPDLIKKWLTYYKAYEDMETTPQTIKISYESLIGSPVHTIGMIFYRMGARTTEHSIINAVDHHAFRKVHEQNPTFYRKGIVGDWKNYMNKESITLIGSLIHSL